jgi:hypothetical protein
MAALLAEAVQRGPREILSRRHVNYFIHHRK